MKIPCTSCNQRLDIPEELAGHTIECPACNASFTVPDAPAKTSPSPLVQVQNPVETEASNKNSISSKLKLAIATVAGTAVVVIASIIFFSDTKIEPVAEVAQTEPSIIITPEISIHEAAETENIEAVQAHLAAGTDINAKDGGFTPLHLAIGNKEIVQLLITKGADVNARSVVGWTPLQYATGDNKKDVVELLIAEGADVNAKGGIGGGTSLYLAAMSGHKELVELLIAADADVNVRESQLGMTPLDMADDKGTAELLRKHGGKTGEELKAAGN